jgi:phage shock protein PspC (stress-responsive transcriptional regulator)
MRRVITASLHGNAFQIEDDAYAVLATYLENGTRALAGNPDKDEIIADVEQAIADKFQRYLNSHKTVIALDELNQVLAEMGPVDGGEATAGAEPSAAGTAPPPGAAAPEPPPTSRRLYQISEGAVISGVCNGIAAYFGIDVTIVRVLFVVFALIYGIAIPIYLVLMFVVPYAQTSEQRAQAHGIPFNARTLVEGAKAKAAEFTHGDDWRRSRAEWRNEWRRTRAEWRADWRRAREERRASRRGIYTPPPGAPPTGVPAHAPAVAHLVSGFVVTILGIFLSIFTVACFVVLISLVTTGAIFGWFLPHGVPFWVGIILLFMFYEMVSWPIKAIRHAHYYADGHDYRPRHPFDGFVGLAVLAILAWVAYHHIPEVRDLFDHIRNFWDGIVDV